MNATFRTNVLQIGLRFTTARAYDRGIIAGIGAYVRSSNLKWRLQLVTDQHMRRHATDMWDGVIADFDDDHVSDAFSRWNKPIVVVASSRASAEMHPARLARVASDNHALIRLAIDHLQQRGLIEYAFYSKPKYAGQFWAEEREQAFLSLMDSRSHSIHVMFKNQDDATHRLATGTTNLQDWLQSLPKPCGVIAVNDSSAQELIHECDAAGISIPDQIAVVGIDNDQTAASLSRVSITSVVQNTEEIGRTAAQLLHKRLRGERSIQTCVLIPPAAINVMASSMHEPGVNPLVTRARNFIRQFAGQGIKSDQVAHYLKVSNSTIERVFRTECGCSVHDEILRVRLEMAKQLLESGVLSVAQVATRCGFRTPQYMHVVFKRELACTPGEYLMSRTTSAFRDENTVAI